MDITVFFSNFNGNIYCALKDSDAEEEILRRGLFSVKREIIAKKHQKINFVVWGYSGGDILGISKYSNKNTTINKIFHNQMDHSLELDELDEIIKRKFTVDDLDIILDEFGLYFEFYEYKIDKIYADFSDELEEIFRG